MRQQEENYGQRYGSWKPTLMPIVCLLLPHLCLILLRLFCYAQTDAYALVGHLLVAQTNVYGQWPSSFPPSTPCAPERLADVPVCCGGMALAPFLSGVRCSQKSLGG